ncbi:MAG: phage GP46 family protein [Pseudomonadota bacterium]
MKITPLTLAAETLLDPDIVWNGRVGSLRVTPHDHPSNPAGFQAEQAIATAVLICLQTDRRVDPSELADGEENRGWPGDGFDLEPGETPLGSRLWLLRRRALTEEIEIEAQDYAEEALQTLIDQGVFVRVKATARADFEFNRLDLTVDGFGEEGAATFHERYQILWDQLDGVSAPLA